MLTLPPKLLYLNNSSSTNWARQALYVAAPEVFDESTVFEASGDIKSVVAKIGTLCFKFVNEHRSQACLHRT